MLRMTFCLIHGGWHDEACWELVVPLLVQAGHLVVTPRLPIDDCGKHMPDYADFVLFGAGLTQDAIVVGHSLGSDVAAIVACKTRVARVVYLCPRMRIFDRPDGEPAVFREGVFDLVQEDSMGRSYWPPDGAAKSMYPRLDRKIAERMASRLRPQCDAWPSPTPFQPATDTPTTFLYTREDEILRPEWSAWAARNIAGVEPIVWEGGHFPMLERPAEMANFLLSLVDARAV